MFRKYGSDRKTNQVGSGANFSIDGRMLTKLVGVIDIDVLIYNDYLLIIRYDILISTASFRYEILSTLMEKNINISLCGFCSMKEMTLMK